MTIKCNPEFHHRRSIRLRDYDYSQAGAYFVTICTKDKACMFGNITSGKMTMNGAGEMIENWWRKIPDKFATVEIDIHTIMPNHFHGIITIVGATPCGRPAIINGQNQKIGQPHRVAPTLGNIMDWFKTMTTNDYIAGVAKYNWSRFNGKLWQRNYYEHIIRNEPELHKIREYIVNNPLNWETDENYKN